MAKTKAQIKAEKQAKADKSRVVWLAPKTVATGVVSNVPDVRTQVDNLSIGQTAMINGEEVTRLDDNSYRVKVRSGKIYEGDKWAAYSAVGGIIPRRVPGQRVK